MTIPIRLQLTPRELEIMKLSDQGLLTADIAKKLHLAAETIKFHKSAAFRKLGVNSIQGALYESRKRGILECGCDASRKLAQIEEILSE